jgi:hypothetical protein
MTDPLEALESLVAAQRREAQRFRGFATKNGDEAAEALDALADELEPIIQQLLTERDELRRSRDAASALAASFRFSEREWRDKAQDKIAEVEKLSARIDSMVAAGPASDEAREMYLDEHNRAYALEQEVESLRAEEGGAMSLVHDPAAHPAWCEEHEDFAWGYSDGSGGCFYTCIVETGSSECRLVPLKPLELAVAKEPKMWAGGPNGTGEYVPRRLTETTQPSDTEEAR